MDLLSNNLNKKLLFLAFRMTFCELYGYFIRFNFIATRSKA